MNNDMNGNLSYGQRVFSHLRMLSKQAGMENDRRIIQSLKLISFKINRPHELKEIYTRALQLIIKSPGYVASVINTNPFLPYPDPRISDGEIRIGFIHDEIRKIRYPFGISRNELMQHMLESGRAGSGKTTLLIHILISLAGLEIPFWIFDFKRDYRSLIRLVNNVHIFNWKNFRFNPLSPPKGTPAVQWASIITEIFFLNFYSSAAASAKSIFLDNLIELYDSGQNVTIQGLCDLMTKKLSGNTYPGSTKESIKTIMTRLRPFQHILGDALCEDGFKLEELMDKSFVLELDGLGIEYQTFIATILFHWLFTYRLCLAQRGELRHILLFDEAKRLFSRGNPLVAQLVSTAREFGQGLILADQMPSCLDDAVLANVYTTITLNTASMREIQAAAYTMGLNDEQRECLSSLPLKTAIVKIAGRHPKPFMIHIPDSQIEKSISDDEVNFYMRDKIAELENMRNGSKPPEKSFSSENKTENDEMLSDGESLLLHDIKNHPFTPATERLKSLNITMHMGQKLYSGLVAKGLVDDLEIKVNYRGRPQKFFQLTDKGSGLVGIQNLGPGKGGFEHRLHQQRLKDVFSRQGYNVNIEVFRNGKAADLGLEKDGQSIAVEIAMSPQGEISNIEKDIAAGWKEIWTLCHSETILNAVIVEWAQIDDRYPGITVKIRLLSEKEFF